jgi:hypothetical protein
VSKIIGKRMRGGTTFGFRIFSKHEEIIDEA